MTTLQRRRQRTGYKQTVSRYLDVIRIDAEMHRANRLHALANADQYPAEAHTADVEDGVLEALAHLENDLMARLTDAGNRQ